MDAVLDVVGDEGIRPPASKMSCGDGLVDDPAEYFLDFVPCEGVT